MNQLPIVLYPPLFVPKKVGENIWIVDGDTVDMDFKLFTVPFSTRMTIIKLENSDLWVHSPVHLTKELKKEIDKLGKVRYLVAPNKLHYSFIEEWCQFYEEANVLVAKGLDKKLTRKSAIKNITHLEDSVSPAWLKEIDCITFKGSFYVEELVFFHQKSKTLIVTDLIENIETRNVSLFQKFLFKIGDNTYPAGRTPRDLRFTFFFQKHLARQSYQKMKDWQPHNLILAHGRCFFGNAMDHLRQAFFWLEK
ncbi:TPA: DUF4336 domain-containing protein [Streptococcus suis]|nr:DUF4336 domain-containing protein [Streptococcus suis]HEL1810901.1 DUF4336 domain-containing protein [Streptococcus suis]